MKKRKYLGTVLAGLAAGAVNGLFGAGGGMVLVPLLCWLTDIEDDEIFPSSISIILPICLISIAITALNGTIAWKQSVPYLIGSCIGGILAGLWGQKIPTLWLHKALGILIIWGGLRYLC